MQERKAHIAAKKRKIRSKVANDAYREERASKGYKEIRGLAVSEEDKFHVETLIDSMNARREKIGDSDVMFRIDNNSETSIVPTGHVWVVIDSKRVQIPGSDKIIQPGTSFIFRVQDYAELVKITNKKANK